MAEVYPRQKFVWKPDRVLQTHLDRSARVPPGHGRQLLTFGSEQDPKTDKVQRLGTCAPFSYALEGRLLHVGVYIGEDLRWRELPNVTRRDGMRKKSNTKS